MLEIPKQYILDEQQCTLAVQISIAVYNQIEEILGGFSLVTLMKKAENDERLFGTVTYSY